MIPLAVPKEIRDDVGAQPARKRLRRKTRVCVVLDLSLFLVWLAIRPSGIEVFVIVGAALCIGVFMVIWTWRDLREMREFDKALWAKCQSEQQSVDREVA